MTGIAHIAGPAITLDGRWQRQRCAWCGAVLIDYDLTRIAVPVDQPGPPATWPEGAIVLVDGGMSVIVVEPDAAAETRVPAETCARIETDRCDCGDSVYSGQRCPGPEGGRFYMCPRRRAPVAMAEAQERRERMLRQMTADRARAAGAPPAILAELDAKARQP